MVWVAVLNGSVLLCCSNTVASHPPCSPCPPAALTGCSQAHERASATSLARPMAQGVDLSWNFLVWSGSRA